MKKIFCNVCGKELDGWDKQQGFNFKGCIGFGSEHDGDFLDVDLCCYCMDKLINSCTLSPLNNN